MGPCELDEQTKQRYVRRPFFCPFCEGSEITGHQAEFDSDYAWRSVTCDECDAEWHDIYEIVGIEPVQVKEL